jgi:hypothetical protein
LISVSSLILHNCEDENERYRRFNESNQDWCGTLFRGGRSAIAGLHEIRRIHYSRSVAAVFGYLGGIAARSAAELTMTSAERSGARKPDARSAYVFE